MATPAKKEKKAESTGQYGEEGGEAYLNNYIDGTRHRWTSDPDGDGRRDASANG